MEFLKKAFRLSTRMELLDLSNVAMSSSEMFTTAIHMKQIANSTFITVSTVDSDCKNEIGYSAKRQRNNESIHSFHFCPLSTTKRVSDFSPIRSIFVQFCIEAENCMSKHQEYFVIETKVCQLSHTNSVNLQGVLYRGPGRSEKYYRGGSCKVKLLLWLKS